MFNLDDKKDKNKNFKSRNDRICFLKFLETNFNIFSKFFFSQIVYVHKCKEKRIHKHVFWLSADLINSPLKKKNKEKKYPQNQFLNNFSKEIKAKIIFLDVEEKLKIEKNILLSLQNFSRNTEIIELINKVDIRFFESFRKSKKNLLEK